YSSFGFGAVAGRTQSAAGGGALTFGARLAQRLCEPVQHLVKPASQTTRYSGEQIQNRVESAIRR
ncbi:hypothetical protein DK058_26170, partial [Salmonella enterica subsp. enterica serovar Typhi]|nr:hypothetical protein [Salmonella enterica subsp. enterica serovar Typhi]